jgi:ketosteroid isomerase-like protein
MAPDDVALVERWFEGLRRGELNRELCDPEIVIRNWAESPVLGPYHGHDGVERWWVDLAEAFEEMRFELKETTDLGDGRVLTEQRIVGRFRLTGIELDSEWGSIIAVGDGKILSATGFASPNRARKAAGLAPRGDSAA